MCGRFTLRARLQAIAKAFEVFDAPELPPRGSAAMRQTDRLSRSREAFMQQAIRSQGPIRGRPLGIGDLAGGRLLARTKARHTSAESRSPSASPSDPGLHPVGTPDDKV
jgi:hypothetical protein